jgi:hypothetical protein
LVYFSAHALFLREKGYHYEQYNHSSPNQFYSMASSNPFAQLKTLVDALEADFEKFYEKGNQAAGTRARQGLTDLKNKAQEIRLQVQDLKNGEA